VVDKKGYGEMKANWFWKQIDKQIAKNTYARALKASHVLADEVRRVCPVGTISHPMYKTGKHAGQPWTRRDAGSLKKTVRVVEKKEKYGLEAWSYGGMVGGPRVYVGDYYAYYAAIVEFYTPFMRKAAERMKPQIKNILENG